MTTMACQLLLESGHLVLVDEDGGPQPLELTPRSLAARHWPGSLPGLLQIERAIDDVENAIEAAGWRHADRDALTVAAGYATLLRDGLNLSRGVDRSDVEAAFSRLVASSGEAPHGTWPAERGDGAAALLILRELMHHLGFQSVQEAG